MATVDLGKISFTQKGTYDNSTSYAVKDVVQHTDQNETSSFVKINSTATGQVPQTNGTINTSHWAIFAKGTSLASANQGTYDGSTTYDKGDVVQYTDTGVLSTFLYINTTPASGQTPSTGGTVNSSYWQLIAKGTASVAISWQSTPKTANFTASAAEGYFVDTNGGTFTATLPASPSTGDELILTDLRGTFGSNVLLVDPNGNKIKGSTGTFKLNEEYASVRIVYSGSTYGWIPVSSAAITNTPLNNNPSIEYLVIAGGAGGGGDNGGGGGAGGYRASSLTASAGTTYTITVGGGSSGITGHSAGNNASNSIFGSITSTGGGGGGSQAYAGGDGGSGGGSGQSETSGTRSGGSGTTGQGTDGGDSTGTTARGGGGGGSSQAGQDGGANTGGNGGDGTSSSITGSAVKRAAGGGGGADQNAGSAGSAETDAGATAGGSGTGNASNASANTGSGAGGGGQSGTAQGGNGGSGVVILKILTSEYTGSTTGSPSVATDGSYKILTYTGNGSYTA